MKINQLHFAIVFALILSSCDSPTAETEHFEELDNSEIVLDADASNWTKYEGTIPCADCEGIKMELLLENNPSNKENEYELTETYLGTKEGNRSYISRGIYEISYGLEENSSTIIISLFNGDQEINKIFIQENERELLLVGNDGKIIESNLNYRLTKV